MEEQTVLEKRLEVIDFKALEEGAKATLANLKETFGELTGVPDYDGDLENDIPLTLEKIRTGLEELKETLTQKGDELLDIPKKMEELQGRVATLMGSLSTILEVTVDELKDPEKRLQALKKLKEDADDATKELQRLKADFVKDEVTLQQVTEANATAERLRKNYGGVSAQNSDLSAAEAELEGLDREKIARSGNLENLNAQKAEKSGKLETLKGLQHKLGVYRKFVALIEKLKEVHTNQRELASSATQVRTRSNRHTDTANEEEDQIQERLKALVVDRAERRKTVLNRVEEFRSKVDQRWENLGAATEELLSSLANVVDGEETAWDSFDAKLKALSIDYAEDYFEAQKNVLEEIRVESEKIHDEIMRALGQFNAEKVSGESVEKAAKLQDDLENTRAEAAREKTRADNLQIALTAAENRVIAEKARADAAEGRTTIRGAPSDADEPEPAAAEEDRGQPTRVGRPAGPDEPEPDPVID